MATNNLSNIASTVSSVAKQVSGGGLSESQRQAAYNTLASANKQLESMKSSGSVRSGVDYKELDQPLADVMSARNALPAVITPQDITTPTPKIPVFQPQDLTGVFQGLQKGADIQTIMNETAGNQQQNLKQLYELIGTPPSTAEAYQQAQRETGIVEKQRQVNDLSAQLNQITAQAQANQLSLVGQGRGIPEAIIGGQQAQIAREAAIQALPVSAALQAAQGNLEMAQQNLNTLFQIKSQDATNQYNFKKEVVKSIYDMADKQEQRKLDYAMKLEDRKYKEEQDNLDTIRSITMTAMKNGAPASFAQKSSTFKTPEEAMAAATGYFMSPMEKLQIQKANMDIAESRAKLNALSTQSPNQEKIDGAIAVKNLISDLNTMKGKAGAVGASFQKLITWGNLLPGSDASAYKATVDQLIDTLAAENLSKLKGPMSDKDIIFVRNIATKLNTSLSEEAFDAELNKLDSKFNEVLSRNGINASAINTYSGMSNEQLMSMASSQITNKDFFSK